MKKLFFFTTFTLIILLFGCDNKTVNNPVSPNSVDKSTTNVNTIKSGDISVDTKLIDPIGYKNDYKVDGNINYTEELLRNNSVTTALGYEARLAITITATLTDNSLSTGKVEIWKISDENESLINVPTSGSNEFVKSYPVIGSSEGLILVCTFEATTHGLLLKNVDLISQKV